MSPRKQVKSLNCLALQRIGPFVHIVVENASNRIVAYGNSTRYSSNAEYRRVALEDYIKKFRQYIFDFVIPTQVDDVVQQVIMGVKLSADARRFTWRPG